MSSTTLVSALPSFGYCWHQCGDLTHSSNNIPFLNTKKYYLHGKRGPIIYILSFKQLGKQEGTNSNRFIVKSHTRNTSSIWHPTAEGMEAHISESFLNLFLTLTSMKCIFLSQDSVYTVMHAVPISYNLFARWSSLTMPFSSPATAFSPEKSYLSFFSAASYNVPRKGKQSLEWQRPTLFNVIVLVDSILGPEQKLFRNQCRLVLNADLVCFLFLKKITEVRWIPH